MSGLTDRLRQGTKEYSVGGGEVAVLGMKAGQLGAMLDVIDAAEQVNELHVRDALARFREVSS